ncbi:MAG: alpha-2-macroglobulin family protein [Cyclobacteriaceae bacterium]
MKTFSLKKIGRVGLMLSFITLVLFNCKSKSGKPSATYINPAFGEYISSYTAGVISSGSSIRVIFTKEAVDSTSIGQETSVKLFNFSPSLKGKTTWLDRRTIEFKPETRMNAGQVFEVAFNLSKLFAVSKELASFDYSFQVMPQNFELSIDNLKPYIKTELKRQKVEGTLTTADFAEAEAVEKIISAQQEGKNLKINWQHAGEGKQHSFVIEEVARKEAASAVKISANGKSIGIDRTKDEDVEVPALGDFKLMSAKVVQNPNQYVALQFSDPLKEKQQLVGLITIGDQRNITLDFDIHDNEIWVYPPVRQAGTKTIYLEAGIRNINDYKMNEASTTEVIFEQLKPEVRFLGKGSILPSTDGLILPFEAVNLKAVDINVNKIFENNILQFLQRNNLAGNEELYRVGKNVLRKTIQLDNAGVTDLGKWNRYTLDLAKLINTEPGAIYQITMKFKKKYASYTCEGQSETEIEIETDDELEESGYRDYYYENNYDYYDGEYDWEQRDNPCNGSFYSANRNVQKNVLASDLGLIAKRGDDGNTTIIVTDLKTTAPISGVSVEVYDFQQQLLGTLSTGSDGKAELKSKETPFAVIAKSGAQRGYMRLVDGESLSLSGFDVSGDAINKGLKGFLYGERGVWRPGDSLYLSFILEDKNKVLPASHPVVFELQNPQGVVSTRLVKSSSENGFYRFTTATAADAPTGNWTGRIKVGGTEFNQTIKIETVKPNRLKINLDLGQERLTSPEVKANLEVKWLHGAPGKNLKAQFDVTVSKGYTTFTKYDDFEFEEPSNYFNPETKTFFEGFTDAEGKATINTSLTSSTNYPGFMNAVFRGKVFEESGNFSIDRFSLPFYPYESYVGLRTPKGEDYSNMLYVDTDQKVDVVFLDVDGKPVDRTGVEINLYRLERYWWWDNSYDNIANYIEGHNSSLAANGTLNTSNGKASWNFKVALVDWGTYYIKVCDPISGHCTGKTVYLDQPGYFGRNSREETKTAATRLTFSSDKTKYNVGEKINLSIPGSGEGRALVSIENGSKILSTQWIETKKGENKLSIEATTEMTPNIFVNVTMLQPHSQTINDLPIRLYGVIPLGVENPTTHLEPVIEMPSEIEPGQEVRIKISEKSKRKMTFTLAMVDEGLLDITKYKTPEPWKKFYAREALGVKTWDLYDEVMGAFGSSIERLLAIGGGDEAGAKEDDPRANRFKPVVKYFGPITLDGGSKELKFTMPNYIGSVKVMAVAGYEGAYGNTEKVVPVRKPLMVLATLPRVLGPEERVRLPITLFTQDKKIKNVKVEVKVSGPISIVGESTLTGAIPTSGDITVDFDLAVKSETGIGKIMVTATSGSYTSTDEIEIEIRNPNVPATQVTEMFLEAGKSWDNTIVPVGVAGTNSSMLEVSSIPPINLGYRLRYLIEYPHGCIEQTTSSAFPQLYLDVVKELSESEKTRTKFNVTKAIERLKMFITRDGGFAYWPGNEDSDSWGTTYAGHFLLSAIDKGYFVPDDMLKRWKKYQKNKAAEWRRNDTKYYYYNTDLIQAYRLYTLALAGAPELGAMNRLREMKDVSLQAKWMLAASYVKAGQPEAAKSLVANLTTTIKAYQEMSYSYGSDERDKAIILETLILLNEKTKAFELVRDISKSLSDQGNWMSTQTIAYCLKSIGQFVSTEKRGDLQFAYAYNGKQINATTQLPLAQVPLEVKGTQKGSIKVTNQSGGGLFVRVINTGTPARGNEQAEQSNLVLYASFTDRKGNQLDVTKLEQGTEFLATVTVKNPGLRGGYENMALSQVFPSGWEINNLRLTDDEDTQNNDRGDYQDIRDDRVYTYFRLGANAQRTFRVSLTASYAGSFYLPGASCEAMYDNSVAAKEKGQVVEVAKREKVTQ